MSDKSNKTLPRIVVLGAGFTGLSFCRNFSGKLAHVTVVDRQNHHLFQPLLYQVATAGLSAEDIAQPIRALLGNKDNFTVRMACIEEIDLAHRRVILDRGELSYDYLVIALGGRVSYFGHPEWAEFAPSLKTLDDAMRIRRQILLAFEQAETEKDARVRAEWMTIVIVGAGTTGVELAGSIAELARLVLRDDFAHIDSARATIIVVEGGERVLPTYPADLSVSARRQLERMGVTVRTGSMVKDIRRDEVILSDGLLRARTIFWAAGVAAVSLAGKLGVPTDRHGRIHVEPDLSLPGHPEVFAGGDIVTIKNHDGGLVPGEAPAAMQMGRHIMRTITAELAHAQGLSERPSFHYQDKGNLAVIGRSAAVARIGRLHFSGRPAWFGWLTVHLIFLVGLRNRISVFASWIYSYFTYRKRARIILGEEAEAKE